MGQLDEGSRVISLDAEWEFSYGLYNAMAVMQGKKGKTVDLPHDYMVGEETRPDAPAGPAMGFYDGRVANYTKRIVIPASWKGDKVFLEFDGVMMNASVEVNGSPVATHHYGYTPFCADLTPCIYWGEENRITVTVNPSMQPNSRWYTGAGIYRQVTLRRRPLLHLAADGIYAYTKAVDPEEKTAHVMVEVTVQNESLEDRLVRVEAALREEPDGAELRRSAVICVAAQREAAARVPFTVRNAKLWDADYPHLYTVTAETTEEGTFGVRKEAPVGEPMRDRDETLFGIRTVQADAVHGLRINGQTVKLRGGCVHHDNGLLGAVSVYEVECRKIRKLKKLGYNAVRTAHNPPSKALIEACDRLGMYVLDEAFDAWGMAKQPGDYNQYFRDDWKDDMKAYMLRDRSHPSVILWSTGNEIPERGGLNGGYQLAMELADYARTLDATRPVTNGVCSFWSGLDDKTNAEFMAHFSERMNGQDDVVLQNASIGAEDLSWEERTEPFANALDVVGYNYMEDHYETDGRLYPDRVILGTESAPANMQKMWEYTEKFPYVIGDFTWTCWDYIGEAGIGKSVFAEEGDPILKMGPFALMSHSSEYPWRLGNDADLDINGNMTPQGCMRAILWGSDRTGLYVQDPANFGKIEIISNWGWEDVTANWNWEGSEGKMIRVTVYSAAEETELFLNGRSLGRKPAGRENRYRAVYDVPYERGTLRAVSLAGGEEVSEAALRTTGAPAAVRLTREEDVKGDLIYLPVEITDADGNCVSNAALQLCAAVEGGAAVAGFGSANPKTAENYTDAVCETWRGRALLILRRRGDGPVRVRVSAAGLSDGELEIPEK